MKIELLTLERETEYADFLLKHDHSLFNASLLFRDFFMEMRPDAIPYYFLLIDDMIDSNPIIGGLPSFLVKGPFGPVLNSLPWFGSNPGVIVDDPSDYMQYAMLLQAFNATAKWTDCFSSTFIAPPNQQKEFYDDFFLRDEEVFAEKRIGLITVLPEFKNCDQFAEDLLEKVHPKTKNQIIKSINTCQVFESYREDDWDFLKTIHKENMEAVGAMVKDREFDVIREHFKKGEDYKLYVALTNDDKAERVAILLLEYYNKTVEYITPAIKKEYRELCPMHLLIFSAMGDAAQKGYQQWNWGGTKLPEQNGVYHFKKRFGADQSEYKYYTKIRKPLTTKAKPKWFSENYDYFYVIPYNLLEAG